MDWAGAIEKSRDDLLDIVARLFVLAGIRTGRSVIALPRYLRIRILAMLRPAEFAARRLIAVAACKLVVVALSSVVERSRRGPDSVVLGLDPKGKASRPIANTASGSTLPAFSLFDPFKPFSHPWLEDGVDGRAGSWRHPEMDPTPNDRVDARALCRRIRALERALQDLEGQAARLARWRARRHRETCKPRRFSPLRPGRPPGWRKRPKTALEEVLKECDFLARDAWNTS